MVQSRFKPPKRPQKRNDESSVLKCNVEDDGCAVCCFLNGKEDKETLMKVIEVLDRELSKSEIAEKKAYDTIAILSDKIEELLL